MTSLPQSELFARALALMGQPGLWRDIGDARVLLVQRRLPVIGHVTAALRADVTCAHALRSRGPTFIEPERPLSASGYLRVMTPATIAEIDLSPDAANRRAALHGKWRNRLVLAEQAGLTLRMVPASGRALDQALTVETAQRRTRGYRAWPVGLMAALVAAGPQDVRLHLAERQGERLASMLIARHGPCATYLAGWSGDAGRATSAHHLILWDACVRLRDEGVTQLDLGTIDTDTAPGLARFKLGAGGLPRALGGSWVRLPWAGRTGR